MFKLLNYARDSLVRAFEPAKEKDPGLFHGFFSRLFFLFLSLFYFVLDSIPFPFCRFRLRDFPSSRQRVSRHPIQCLSVLRKFGHVSIEQDFVTREFYLRLRKHQRGGHFEPLRSAKVLVLSKLFLQLEKLLRGESSSWSSSFAEESVLGGATFEQTSSTRLTRLFRTYVVKKHRKGNNRGGGGNRYRYALSIISSRINTNRGTNKNHRMLMQLSRV